MQGIWWAAALPWLTAAVFVNALAQVPYGYLQAGDGARGVALLHVVELPLFALALWWLIPAYGVVGGAAAWGGRMVVDAVAMWGLAWVSGRRG